MISIWELFSNEFKLNFYTLKDINYTCGKAQFSIL